MIPVDNFKFVSGGFSVRLTKEYAEKILSQNSIPVDNEKQNGIFHGPAGTHLRFQIGRRSGGDYFFTSKSDMFMITDEVIKCYQEAVKYIESVRITKPTKYGDWSVNWNTPKPSKRVTITNQGGARVGTLYMTGFGLGIIPRIDLDKEYVGNYNFPLSDIKHLEAIMEEAKKRLA